MQGRFKTEVDSACTCYVLACPTAALLQRCAVFTNVPTKTWLTHLLAEIWLHNLVYRSWTLLLCVAPKGHMISSGAQSRSC